MDFSKPITIENVLFVLCLIMVGLILYLVIRSTQKGAWEKELSGPGLSLRKVALYLAFVGLGVLFVAGQPLLHYLVNLGVPHALPGDLNATGAEVEANATGSGWVPLGTATSKIIMTCTFYVLSYILPWVIQQVTHPVPTDWTKESYKTEFQALPSLDKFTVVRFIGLNQSIRWAASLLAAALIV